MEAPVNFYNYTRDELTQIITQWGLPRYNASQIFQWLYMKKVKSFEDMTDLSKNLREELNQKATLATFKLHTKQVSKDGTAKYLWELKSDDQSQNLSTSSGQDPSTLCEQSAMVESVLIPMALDEEGEPGHYTACLSTQAGCRMKCAFCATGIPKFKRDLTTAEIVCQLLFMEQDSGADFSNVVLMGMGEPLDNYDNTQKATRILHDPEGFNLGRRRVTISTSGLIDRMNQFIKDDWPVSLAVSFHSADPDIRSRIMPINRSNPLDRLHKMIKDFTRKRRLPVTLEYILLKDVNDRPEDAQKLAAYCKDLLCKINLIRYNPVPTLPYESPTEERVLAFRADLKNRGLQVFLRERRGVDISAACGQLGFDNAVNKQND